MSANSTGRPTRRRVVFHGRVQGVFFRATSREIARRFAVVGFVRNLSDGTVELEAEGAPDQVDSLLAAIGEHFAGNITRADETPLATDGAEKGFDVRY